MAYLHEAEVRAVGERASRLAHKSAREALKDSVGKRVSFDVFLSHSFQDADLVLGIVRYLEERDLTVYVDWLVDPELDRTKVDAETAHTLRERMGQCSMLVYLWSTNAPASKWMPWELGYFDALRGKVAVLPILRAGEVTFTGSEFVALYPVVDVKRISSGAAFEVDGMSIKSWSSSRTWTIQDMIRRS